MTLDASERVANGDAKGRVLAAAVELFASKGFDATSVREVAEAARVTKPTLYYYFGSKDGLGLAIVNLAEGIIETYVERMTKGRGGIVERLEGFVEAHFMACRENQALARFLYSLTFAPRESQPRFDVEHVHHKVRDTLTEVLVEAAGEGLLDRTRVEEANLILTGILNIYLMAFLNHGLELDRGRAQRAVAYFLDGVRLRGGPPADPGREKAREQ